MSGSAGAETVKIKKSYNLLRISVKTVGIIALAFASICFAEEPVYLQGGFLQKYDQHDSGTLFLYIANTGRSRVRISQILLDGKPLGKDMKEIYSTIWHRAYPNPLPSGRVCEVSAVLSGIASRPMRFGVRLSGGKTIEKLILPAQNPTRIESISFSEDYSKSYIYIKNMHKNNMKIEKIRIDTKDVTKLCSIPQPEMEQGDIVPVVVRGKDLFKEGSHITLAVNTSGGGFSAATVRVMSGFPIAPESGDWRKLEGLESGTENLRVAMIYACPMHTAGSRRGAALEILQKLSVYKGNSPTSVHVCRNRIEKGLFMYGRIADVMRTNPHNKSQGYDPKSTPEKHETEYICRLARECCMPKPWHTVVVAGKNTPYFGTRLPGTDEVRLQVFYAIANGAKGILYRMGGWEGEKAKHLANGMASLNSELCAIREHLAIGQPVEWAESNHEMIEARFLLCGLDRGVLVLINHDNKSADKIRSRKDRVFLCNPHKGIVVTLRVPEWFKIGRVTDVSSKKEVSVKKEKGTVIFPVGTVGVARALTIGIEERK